MLHLERLLNRGRRDDKDTAFRKNAGNDGNEPFEGFICPSCHSVFSSDGELKKHFENEHGFTPNVSSHSSLMCPKCSSSFDNETELLSHGLQEHQTEQVEVLRERLDQLTCQKDKLKTDIEISTKKNEELGKSRDELYDELKQQSSLLKKCEAELVSCAERAKNSELQLSEAKQTIFNLETEIDQRPSADDVELLKREIVRIQQMMDKASLMKDKELEIMQKKCNDKSEEVVEWKVKAGTLQDKIQYLEKDKRALKEKERDFQVQVAALQNHIKNLEQTCKQTEELLHDSETRLAEREKEIGKIMDNLRSAKEEVNQEKAERLKIIAKIQEGDGATTAIEQLKAENVSLLDQLQTIATVQVQEMSSLKADLKYSQKECKEVKQKLEILTMVIRSSERWGSSMHNEVENVHELFNCIKGLVAKLIENHATCQKVNGKSLEEAMKKVEKIYVTETHMISFLNGVLGKLHMIIHCEGHGNEPSDKPVTGGIVKALFKLEHVLKTKSKALAAAQVNLSECEKKMLDKTNEFTQQLSDVQQTGEMAIAELSNELKQIKAHRDSCLEKLQSYERIEHEAKEQIDSLQSTVISLKEANTGLEADLLHAKQEVELCLQNIKNSEDEKSILSRELNSCKEAINQHSSLVTNLQSSLDVTAEQLEKTRNEKEKVIQDFEAAKQLLVNSNVKYEKEIEALNCKLLKETKEMNQKISELVNEKNMMETAKDELSSELKALHLTYKQREKEWENSEAHYTTQIKVYTENANTLKSDILAEQKWREQCEKNLDEVTGLKLELEAKLENALEERKALLDRCVKSEAEKEKLVQISADLRRKHDDAVAALQELGRENQALQIENSKHSERKWADDEEFTHCTACGKAFSVTVRRHHCRNCGSIFCNECSSKTATVASSKKPARVCDQCFKELSK